MRHRLWKDDLDECTRAFADYQKNQAQQTALTLLAFDDSEAALGFIEGELRSDYVEGADIRPIGYVEGVYIDPHARRQGVGDRLIREFAKRVNATTLASDTEVKNERSQEFHKAIGFREVQRTVNFILNLDDPS